MSSSLTIAARFNGPPRSGNGGYVAGLLSRHWFARHGASSTAGSALPIEVTLRAPPPLDTELALADEADEGLALMHERTLLAQARKGTIDLALPAPPSMEQASAAGAIGRLRAAKGVGNAYFTCFGCGVGREAHDGLRLVPSPLGDEGVVATDWTPHAAFADPHGDVLPEIVWAALDCPAGIAWNYRLVDGPPLVTGRMTVAIDAPIRAGARLLVLGWPIAADGRKLHAGSALFDARGRVLARSRQLWMIPRAE